MLTSTVIAQGSLELLKQVMDLMDHRGRAKAFHDEIALHIARVVKDFPNRDYSPLLRLSTDCFANGELYRYMLTVILLPIDPTELETLVEVADERFEAIYHRGKQFMYLLPVENNKIVSSEYMPLVIPQPPSAPLN